MGSAGNNQLASAIDTAGTSALRILTKTPESICDAITDQPGIARAVAGDVPHQLVQVIAGTRRKPNPHPPPLPRR